MTLRGFTLIETLIYVAVFALLVAGTFASLVSLAKATRRTDAQLALHQAAGSALEYISLYARDANTVYEPLPNTSSDRLSVSTQQGSRNFTASSFGAAQLLFERSAAPDDPDHVRISIVLTGHTDGMPITATTTRVVYLPP